MCTVDLLIGRNVAGLQVSFPIFVSEAIPPFSNGLRSQSSVKSRGEGSHKPDLKLHRCPRVEIDRFDFADVCSHGPVNTRASDAQKHAAEWTVLADCHPC